MKTLENAGTKIVLISDLLFIIAFIYKQIKTFNSMTGTVDYIDLVFVLLIVTLTFTFVIITVRSGIITYIDKSIKHINKGIKTTNDNISGDFNATYKMSERHENVISHILTKLNMVDEMNNLKNIVEKNKGLAGLSDLQKDDN